MFDSTLSFNLILISMLQLLDGEIAQQVRMLNMINDQMSSGLDGIYLF